MRHFEFIDGKSSKFWEIEQEGNNLNIRWGKIGTTGQSQTKTFADDAKAAAAMLKLVTEKTGKGYLETGATATSAAPATGATPAPKAATQTPTKPATSKAATPKAVAPKNDEALVLGSEPAPAPSAAPTAKAKASAETAKQTPPETTDDDEAERVLRSKLEKIAQNELKEREQITISSLRKEYGVSEAAAKQAFLRLNASGILWRWSSTTGAIHTNSMREARALLATMAHLEQKYLAPRSIEETAHLAPWLQTPYFRPLPELLVNALPSRRFPQERETPEAARSWVRLRELFTKYIALDISGSDACFNAALDELATRISSRKMDGSPQSDSLLFAASLAALMRSRDSNLCEHVIDFLIARHDLPYMIQTFLDVAQAINFKLEYQRNDADKLSFSAMVTEPLIHEHYRGPLHNGIVHILRSYLSVAPEAVYRCCVDKIRAQIGNLHPHRQALFALMLPDEPEIANQTALRLKGQDATFAHWLQLVATDPEAIKVARKSKTDTCCCCDSRSIATLFKERELESLPFFIDTASHQMAGIALTCIGLPEAVEALARAASSSKEALTRYQLAVARWPAAAMAALAKLVAQNGKEATLVTSALLQLIQDYPALIEKVIPFIEPSSAATLNKILERIEGPKDVASAAELPSVLVNPPWLQAKTQKIAAPLVLETLPVTPIEHWAPGEKEAQTPHSEWYKRLGQEIASDPLNFLLHIDLAVVKPKTKEVVSKNGALALFQASDAIGLADLWITEKNKPKSGMWRINLGGIQALPESFCVPFINHLFPQMIKSSTYFYGGEEMTGLFGLKILPAILALVTSRPSEYLSWSLNFGAIEFSVAAARAFSKSKSLQKTGREWLLRFPEHAIAGLLPAALGKKGEMRDCAAIALRFLLKEGHGDLLKTVAARYQRADVMEALDLMINENPLDRYPSKRPALPAFWQSAGWHRPQLKNGKPLPNAAIDIIGTMLTFPTNEGLYQGILDVKEACLQDSLADFSWDIFSTWLASGAPSKDNWALTALGYLGNDATARKLTPYIREWPGEAAHARAVTGLDVLARIGSDVSLMLLNGIAQKVKFKGLQDKAREKIDEIASMRGLSPEELEDRLVPDLGLDERGTLLLDFGPRQFKVGFDETLKPYVRELDADGRMGKRLSDLPKPNKSDQAETAKAAVDRFKLLKKDAKTIASQQVIRLEIAMCTRRRWTQEVFKTFLAEHPLVRHLVERLVWGVYELPEEEHYGGKLLSCFRVSEDGSITNADDDPHEFPDGESIQIGLPHALEIPAQDAAAFGQLFADYELLQPFRQLGRSIYSLTDEEKKANILTRYKNRKVATGKILGLANKGWRRGEAQDGGGIWYFTKAIDKNYIVELDFSPGMTVGMLYEEPEQSLEDLRYGKRGRWGEIENPEPLGQLDPITASELIMDMESLCS